MTLDGLSQVRVTKDDHGRCSKGFTPGRLTGEFYFDLRLNLSQRTKNWSLELVSSILSRMVQKSCQMSIKMILHGSKGSFT
jgi:hypothetical protein